ncbi:hypothetical protein [Streptomyces sp. NPDC059783]|uniref:hypothetical protein n=1 Tax=Streptomyces sp. NPDC059783 TaxID=3346944 RepID=UPI003652BFB6
MDAREEPGHPAGAKVRSARVRLRRASALVLFLGLLVAGPAGCAEPPGPGLVVPPVLYVPRDPQSPARLSVEETRAAGATVTFDATELKGVAAVETALDACPAHPPVFRCAVPDDATAVKRSGQAFRLRAAGGAAPGDTAVLRYRVSTPGRPTLTGSTRVVVGTPELAVGARVGADAVDPGGTVSATLTVRNTGDVPARGVSFFMTAREGLEFTGRHRNCGYRGGTSAWCRLPASEVVIPPGATYRLRTPEILRADRDATYPRILFEAAALGTDYVPPPEVASRYEDGEGPGLRLVPDDGTSDAPSEGKDGGTGGRGTAELKVPVRNAADLAAVAGTVTGPVGSRAAVRVGVRNEGPGALPATARIEFDVPPGTTVVRSPYEPERDEELIDQDCRALAPDGTPLTEPSARQPAARRYECRAPAGSAGATTTFPFTLRIDAAHPPGPGRVTVSDGASGRVSHDETAANDIAAVAVSVWPGPSWATPALYRTAAIVLLLCAVAGAATALVRRRRRGRAG